MNNFPPVPKKSTDKILEKDVEGPVCRYGRKLGLLVEKFTSPAKRSVPDDIFTVPVKSGVAPCFFIEFKAPGKKPTEKQSMDHERRRSMGSLVYVIDDVELGKRVVAACKAILS